MKRLAMLQRGEGKAAVKSSGLPGLGAKDSSSGKSGTAVLKAESVDTEAKVLSARERFLQRKEKAKERAPCAAIARNPGTRKIGAGQSILTRNLQQMGNKRARVRDGKWWRQLQPAHLAPLLS